MELKGDGKTGGENRKWKDRTGRKNKISHDQKIIYISETRSPT